MAKPVKMKRERGSTDAAWVHEYDLKAEIALTLDQMLRGKIAGVEVYTRLPKPATEMDKVTDKLVYLEITITRFKRQK